MSTNRRFIVAIVFTSSTGYHSSLSHLYVGLYLWPIAAFVAVSVINFGLTPAAAASSLTDNGEFSCKIVFSLCTIFFSLFILPSFPSKLRQFFV